MITVSVGEAASVVASEIKDTVEAVNRQVVSRATRGVNAIRNAELTALRGQRSGRTYKKPGGGTYQASAPGEPPASRTGNLRRNWNGNVESTKTGNGMKVTLQLESGTEYAPYLENGTRRMAPRPFLDRIKAMAEPDIRRIYSEPYK